MNTLPLAYHDWRDIHNLKVPSPLTFAQPSYPSGYFLVSLCITSTHLSSLSEHETRSSTLFKIHLHLPVSEIARVQCRAIHIPPTVSLSASIATTCLLKISNSEGMSYSQTVQCIPIILILHRLGDGKVLEVGFHVGFSHTVTSWAEWCKLN